MKKQITTILFLLISSVSFAQSLTFNISNIKSDTVRISLINKQMTEVERVDTIIAHDGQFTYDYSGDKACAVNVNFLTTEGPFATRAYLVPGENGVLTGVAQRSTWSGSKFYADLAQLEASCVPIKKQMNDMDAEFAEKSKTVANADSLLEAMLPEFYKLMDKMEEHKAGYLKAHPDNNVSVTILGDVHNIAELVPLLTPEVRQGAFSDILEAYQQRADKENARREAAKALAEGNPAPEFTLKDINGNDLALSSLQGKYLILDFWGSWCGWCIKGFPEMKNYYQKYSDKLEILGIDCNDTEAKWKAAVAKHDLPWKHVYCPNTSDVLTRYAVEGFPTKIVIDPEGKIAKVLVGEDPSFYEYLDSLFK